MNFGILCDGYVFQQWQLQAIEKLISGGHSCTLIVVNVNPFQKVGFFKKVRTYPYSKVLIRVWFRFLLKPEAKKLVHVQDKFQGITHMGCKTTTQGFSEFFNSTDIEKIKSFNLDFILRFGFGIIRGEILNAAKYGVWSYHHDDETIYRGVPTGFWEIMFGDPVNAAILQRLTDKLDSGVVLHKAFFATISHSWQANLNNVLQNSTEWPLQVCTKIDNGNTEFLSKVSNPDSRIYKMPDNLRTMHFFLKLILNKLKFQYRDLFLTEKWNVGIIPLPADSLIRKGEYSIPEPTWLDLDKKKSVYYADSFGVVKDDFIHILCEKYDFNHPKGVLTSVLVDKHSCRIIDEKQALDKPYHLAYPFLFENKGEYYCIPESSDIKSIDLYTYNLLSGKLLFKQTLISDIQAVDSSLFEYNGLWWLSFTDKKATNERLHIWYASEMLGPYTPHANNPVKVDVRSSRPAGNPFVLNGDLMRPAQDCSLRSGRRVCINKVLKLNPTDFVEIPYAILNPAFNSNYKQGMHTFNALNQVIIVDGKQERFIWQWFLRKFLKKINKLFSLIK